MSTISGILSISGFNEFKHPTIEDKAPKLTVHHKIWTQVTTATGGQYVAAQVWVSNDGQTLLQNINVTVTVQGGNGIWTPQFCDAWGNLMPDRYQTFAFNTLMPGQTSSVQSYWWKPSKPDVPQNASAFDAAFTAIPDFKVVYADNDEYFTDKSHVTIG